MTFRSLAASIVMYTRSYRTVLLKPCRTSGGDKGHGTWDTGKNQAFTLIIRLGKTGFYILHAMLHG